MTYRQVFSTFLKIEWLVRSVLWFYIIWLWVLTVLFQKSLSDKSVGVCATMLKGTCSLQLLDWNSRCFTMIEENSSDKCIYAFSFLQKHCEPQSSNVELLLPIPFYLFVGQCCWNSCICFMMHVYRSAQQWKMVFFVMCSLRLRQFFQLKCMLNA